MEVSVAAYPPYNRVYGIATHNSYWINRSDQADWFASGTQELISDQLLHEHVRGIELDLHTEGGGWKIYHTSDSEDFLGRNLKDYLDYLRNFQYAVPQHDVINVVIDLKTSSRQIMTGCNQRPRRLSSGLDTRLTTSMPGFATISARGCIPRLTFLRAAQGQQPWSNAPR